MKRKLAGVFIILAALILSACGGTTEDATDSTAEDTPATEQTEKTEEEKAEGTEETKETAKEEEVQEQPAKEATPPDKSSELTLGQRNAIKQAESYLKFTSFSRKGLIEQLEFEGYSTEEATFAVDYLKVDWKEQAAKKAQEYLDFTSFSRQGLIDQLLFEGFTREEAEYGVSAVGY